MNVFLYVLKCITKQHMYQNYVLIKVSTLMHIYFNIIPVCSISATEDTDACFELYGGGIVSGKLDKA